MSKKLSVFVVFIALFVITGCGDKKPQVQMETSFATKNDLCEILVNNENSMIKTLNVQGVVSQQIGPFFLETENSTLKNLYVKDKKNPIVMKSNSIDIKMFSGNMYIFENFSNKRFDKAGIYLYMLDNMHEVCRFNKTIELYEQNCSYQEICDFIKNNNKNLYTKKESFEIDINNDGIGEKLTFVNKLDVNSNCDYETFIIDDTNEDLVSYVKQKASYNFSKCIRSISIQEFENKNFIIIENSDYSVIAFLVEADKISIVANFDSKIQLNKIN